MSQPDEGEILDAETLGLDDTVVEETPPGDAHLHGRLLAPDQLLADDVAELIASEKPAEDPLTAEEAAMHYEEQ